MQTDLFGRLAVRLPAASARARRLRSPLGAFLGLCTRTEDKAEHGAAPQGHAEAPNLARAFRLLHASILGCEAVEERVGLALAGRLS